ncbi:MAG TPA: AMP-binding protein [Candidatus Cybelea sp.]|nr:AMP-binding protein [Candidatus Cybelea sp.]
MRPKPHLVTERVRSLPARINDLVSEWAGWTPDAGALIDGEARWTYAELERAIQVASSFLRELAVRPGDRVMLVNENGRATIALFLAMSALDVWAVMVNARLSGSEIAAVAGHCEPRLVIFTVENSQEAAAHADRWEASFREVPMLGRLGIGPVNATTIPESVDASNHQVAALLYTSGTTGTPKGVMLTHRNLMFNAAISGGTRLTNPRDVVFGAMPIAHVSALASIFLASVYAGACFVCLSRFTPERCLREIAAGVTVLQGVPAMYVRLLAYVRETGTTLGQHRLRVTWAGGSPLDPAVKKAVEDLTGLPLHNGYGLTEASPSIATTRLDHPRQDCSVGPPLPFVEVRIASSEGEPLGTNEVGEIWCRGPNVMNGYYRAPEATAMTITRDGWLKTGDLGRIDSDGSVHISGRSKELIIRSGFNVYPIDVEAVLTTHPEVIQAAVIGAPANDGNEDVIAYVQRASGSTLSADQLAAFCSERLASYKRPCRYVFCEELPAGPTGKILKHRLLALR